jgi:hypothetical protein
MGSPPAHPFEYGGADFYTCHDVKVRQVFVPLRWQAGGSAAPTISAPARGCFFFGGVKMCRLTYYIVAV